MTEIAIVLGSVRENRFGAQIANWVLEQAKAVGDPGTSFKLVDLADYELPVFTGSTPPGALKKHYPNPAVAAWSKALDSADGYVFITAEYNHSIPGAFKNAIDHIGPELNKKAIAFVGYAWDGAIRAVEQWRTIAGQFNMYDIRPQLALSFPHDSEEGTFKPMTRRNMELKSLITELSAASKALKTLR
ncbi:NADPH-dependent FMN reductase [Boudabousia liubingyangii]|uniref:NADPH-dependent FMN reductase n=1 Tax=Boudabousia liubingyangii TaxID=1921764 RepID=A0A1Q5PNK0_9ACTO|nr:NAD(P)H-dependent oxidoreductase [Boudabousia liubingyangii]OKL47643.1 NADPH-dependent FMN reductase [Boudabousia liubingyangii]OKL49069.1 NADPH-dependent FMN reductase [Boudabousia liubingyangii]